MSMTRQGKITVQAQHGKTLSKDTVVELEARVFPDEVHPSKVSAALGLTINLTPPGANNTFEFARVDIGGEDYCYFEEKEEARRALLQEIARMMSEECRDFKGVAADAAKAYPELFTRRR